MLQCERETNEGLEVCWFPPNSPLQAPGAASEHLFTVLLAEVDADASVMSVLLHVWGLEETLIVKGRWESSMKETQNNLFLSCTCTALA